jgi:hypothetical protein
VYVAGSEKTLEDKCVATVWKNGRVLYRLTDGKRDGFITSLYVSGDDVYAAGKEQRTLGSLMTVWKNGKSMHSLTDGFNEARVCSIFVTGR